MILDNHQNQDKSHYLIDSHVDTNKTKQSKLLDLLLSEKITQIAYDAKLLELTNEESQLKTQKKNLKTQDPNSTLELLEEAKKNFCTLQNQFSDGDDEVRKDMLNSALWNYSLKDQKILSIQYKLMYEYLSKVSHNADFSEMLSTCYKVRTYYAQNYTTL